MIPQSTINVRQPATGMMAPARNAPQVVPSPTPVETSATSWPRLAEGTRSARSVRTTGMTPPSPKLDTMRQRANISTFGAVASTAVATPSRIIAPMVSVLRPNRSARRPARTAPSPIATKLAVTMNVICAGPTPHSRTKDGNTWMTMVMSIPSASNTSAMTPNTTQWRAVRPAASRACCGV